MGIPVAKTVRDYEFMLRRLLPRGFAWRPEPGSYFARLLNGFAPELTRIESRARDLLRESNPATAVELRDEWARVVLADPDSVDPDGDITEGLGIEGGNNAQALIDLAARMGFRATIDRFPPFRIGHSGIDRPLYDLPWGSTFRMNIFVTDADAVTAAGGIPDLEESLRKKRPAEAIILFRYLEDE